MISTTSLCVGHFGASPGRYCLHLLAGLGQLGVSLVRSGHIVGAATVEPCSYVARVSVLELWWAVHSVPTQCSDFRHGIQCTVCIGRVRQFSPQRPPPHSIHGMELVVSGPMRAVTLPRVVCSMYYGRRCHLSKRTGVIIDNFLRNSIACSKAVD